MFWHKKQDEIHEFWGSLYSAIHDFLQRGFNLVKEIVLYGAWVAAAGIVLFGLFRFCEFLNRVFETIKKTGVLESHSQKAHEKLNCHEQSIDRLYEAIYVLKSELSESKERIKRLEDGPEETDTKETTEAVSSAMQELKTF